VKKYTLELGGKSALIVHADADADAAVDWASFGIFWNAGQNCTATSRLLVHADLHDRVVKGLVALCQRIKLGSGFDPAATLGPIINDVQYRKIVSYILTGLEQGAKLATGGVPPQSEGYFVAPTIFTNVQPHMTIWREEIFGPVMQIMKFKTMNELIQRANDTRYGLAGAVFTKDVEKAIYVSNSLRAGTVWVNCFDVFDAAAPFGGYKMSGVGREGGEYGLENYTQVKTVTMKISEKNS